MNTLFMMTKRNVKLFFKDKGIFFTSLITPMILLLLYITFLGNVYKDAFLSSIPDGFEIDLKIIEGCVGGQLASSILAVSCVTVAFCANMLIVQDKVTGARNDFLISPAKRQTFAFGYFFSAVISTLSVTLSAMIATFIYIAFAGWYIGALDVIMIIADIFLLSMFGTALSSVIYYFISSQGQMSAVGTLVSSCYGFICGAYMPISNFNETLGKAVSLLPGTYGTSLLRSHFMRGALEKLSESGLGNEFAEQMRDAVDINIYFFGSKVGEGAKWAILFCAVTLFTGVYILINLLDRRKDK